MRYLTAEQRNQRAIIAEQWHAVVMAAAALGTTPDARAIRAEMDSRLDFAFKQWVDNEGAYEEVS